MNTDGVLSIAPMMQWTDRHWRYLMRQLTKKTLLYTEMVMDNAILYNQNNLDKFIGYSLIEEPLVIQLGGNNPKMLAEAAKVCESYGNYHEINLNCGCPSNKAKRNCFGVELMLDPILVKKIVYEMSRQVTRTNISVKCRLGIIDHKETFDDLIEFIESVKIGGVNHVIIHSRYCHLKGLSPAQNRSIPPLMYNYCHKLVELFPEMKFTINGGINTFENAQEHLGWKKSSRESYEYSVHGVMIGREAYNNPWIFSKADSLFFNSKDQNLTRREVLNNYFDYCDIAQANNYYPYGKCGLIKPLHNIFNDLKESVEYKQRLDYYIKELSKNDVSVSDIVMKAVDETICDCLLDNCD